ncbi:hypothetical protein [Cloacibacillus sp. An23]|uniref:hypothetical protein n=1 Tax=Cloacibacillus sp. An23 TaxID=1965591 RepID=UPI0011788884|nr:hypothetical protein [Cloacibacillus sp. An23]
MTFLSLIYPRPAVSARTRKFCAHACFLPVFHIFGKRAKYQQRRRVPKFFARRAEFGFVRKDSKRRESVRRLCAIFVRYESSANGWYCIGAGRAATAACARRILWFVSIYVY